MKLDRIHSTPASSQLDRDNLAMVSQEKASEVAYVVIDHIGQYRPHEAISGVAVAFAAFAARVNMSPYDLADMGAKVLHHRTPHGKSMGTARLEALQDFAKLKLRSDGKGIK